MEYKSGILETLLFANLWVILFSLFYEEIDFISCAIGMICYLMGIAIVEFIVNMINLFKKKN